MIHAEKDLKNKKQEANISQYFFIGVLVIVSFFQIYRILFTQPAAIDFAILLLLVWSAATLYLVDIKQVIERSEKKALLKIVIRCMGIFVGLIVLVLVFLNFLALINSFNTW